ncbi:MAG TPA: hypothetical protein DCE56_27590 [Cyanobacteria bacterium UBA8553]|nr:hypothetical protein [Cyanobacteria bacterium UBA8553]
MTPKLMIYILFDLIKYKFRKPISPNECKAVLDWVMALYLPRGTAWEFQLPDHLANITAQGTVEALRTVDNRYCVLLKTYIGFKDNFEGTLYCNRPLSPNEIMGEPQDGAYICIKGNYYPYYSFKELYVRKRHDNCRFEVYYDLH